MANQQNRYGMIEKHIGVPGVLGGGGNAWYVDSVNGSDSNTGRSSGAAFATIGALTSISAGETIKLARGSVWREQLDITVDGVHVEAYGAGNLPILDASDVAANASFAKTVGRTNVYEISITPAWTAGITNYLNVWEDDVYLVQAASLAACDATPASYFPSAATGTITLYVHATGSGNVVTNGKVYTHSQRAYGLTCRSATGTHITNVVTRKQLHPDGSLIAGRQSVLTGCAINQGNKHNILVNDGCTLTDCTATDCYAYSETSTLFVHNESTPAGLGVTYNNCTATCTASNTQATGFYGHKNVSGSFGTVTYNNCAASNVYYGWDGSDATIILNDCTITDIYVGMLVQTGAIVPAAQLNRVTVSGAALIQAVLIGSAGDAVGGTAVLVNDCDFNNASSNSQTIRVTAPNIALTVQDSTIVSQFGAYNTTAAATGATVTSNRNTLTPGYNWAGNFDLAGADLTYVADYNEYHLSQNFTKQGSNFTSLADWRTETGQEANSTFTA